MDDISHHSLSNASWENPFSFSGNIAPSEVENGEQFFGDELKAFFDKEEKMYQSTSSGKSDQSHSHTEKSSAMMASGITIRSFMVDSGDSELINQKLTMSQYLAYKSEPMGALGDSASFRERPYFSFQEKSIQSSTSEKSEAGVAEFNPDFSQEPSWLKKKSLSSLSSSENLEIPSKSPDSSENWLVGTNKSVSSNSLMDNFDKSEASNYVKDPSIQKSEVNGSNCYLNEPSIHQMSGNFNSRRSDVNSNNVKEPSIQQLTEKFDSRRSDGSNHSAKESIILQYADDLSARKSDFSTNQSNLFVKEASMQQLRESSNSEKSIVNSHYVKESSIQQPAEKSIQVSKTEERPPVTCMTAQDFGETSELPSLYWKPHDNESQIDLGHSHLELVLEKATSRCHSYVAGHVESLSLVSDSSRRPSEVAASSQSSSSRASTVRENTDFPRCDSLISEPQLSSTREITDDYTDMSLSEKRVHFLPDSQRAEVSHISMEKPTLRLDTLLEGPSKPNLCSTAMTPTAKASEHMMRILANLSRRDAEDVDCKEKSQHAASLAKVLQLETTGNDIDLDWQRLERDLTQHDPAAGLSPESWIAVFSNTSSLSTPLLMNKIKEHVLRLHGRGMSSDLLPSESSGIGGSGFETTESRVNSDFDPPSNKGPATYSRPPSNGQVETPRTSTAPSIPPTQKPADMKVQQVPTSNNMEAEGKYLKNRHTLSVMPPTSKPDAGSYAQTPVDCKDDKNFARLTSTVIKKMPTPDGSKPSIGLGKAKANLIEQQQALQAPLVKCNKSQVYFGGAKVRQMQMQNVIVRNSSFKQGLELELRIKDSDAFYLLETDRSLVSRRHVQLDPRQECCVDLVFQPHNLGPSTTKLNLYPRSDSAKKIKYTVDLYGYGGSSQIQQLIHSAGPDQALLPKSKGAHWNCQFVLENRGNVAGFACIQPLQEDGTPMDPYQCIVMPQLCSVNAGDFKEIKVLIHPPKDGKFGSFKLQVLSGDEPLRTRWINCIANGLPVKPPAECVGIDWTRLLQLNCNDNQVVQPAVSEEDFALFYSNARTDEINVIFPDNVQDSHFVTLAVEPATVLEASTVCDTILSQRRMTCTTSGKPPSEMCVSAGVTELIFPSTKVGFTSSQKIPLQNWSSSNQEVRVKDISGPFSMKHTRSAVPGGYYTRLPIQFHPAKSGSHSGCVVLDVGHQGQILTIALKGDAF